MLFVAAGAAFAAISLFFNNSDHNAHASYVCPMHPEVRSNSPGTCPICRMALEPVVRGSHPSAAMPDMTAFENVRNHKILDFVRVHSLLPNLREIRGPAWVESDDQIAAVLYKDQIDALAPDEPGTFALTALPKVSLPVTRLSIPSKPWDRSTSVIHFRIDASRAAQQNRQVKVGQAGWLTVASKPRSVLGVPASAVLQEPEGPYVLVWEGGARFKKQPIEIGELFSRQGFAVVLSGASQNDRVVARATFFVDAERRLSGEQTGDITP